MSTPMRKRKTCTPATAKRLVSLFKQARKLVNERTAKAVAVYVEDRRQQGGVSDPSYLAALKAMKKGTLTGGSSTAEDFDRLTKGTSYAKAAYHARQYE